MIFAPVIINRSAIFSSIFCAHLMLIRGEAGCAFPDKTILFKNLSAEVIRVKVVSRTRVSMTLIPKSCKT